MLISGLKGLGKTKAVHVRFKTLYISGKKNIGKGKR